jgi:hypothetical protein
MHLLQFACSVKGWFWKHAHSQEKRKKQIGINHTQEGIREDALLIALVVSRHDAKTPASNTKKIYF